MASALFKIAWAWRGLGFAPDAISHLHGCAQSVGGARDFRFRAWRVAAWHVAGPGTQAGL